MLCAQSGLPDVQGALKEANAFAGPALVGDSHGQVGKYRAESGMIWPQRLFEDGEGFAAYALGLSVFTLVRQRVRELVQQLAMARKIAPQCLLPESQGFADQALSLGVFALF